jgi:hypothetical protein
VADIHFHYKRAIEAAEAGAQEGAPLAAGLQDIENTVHHLAHIHLARPAATLGRRVQRCCFV